MNHLDALKKIAKELRLAGADQICQKVMIAITDLEETPDSYADLSYSFLMRELRKDDKDKAAEFQEAYKEAFDEAYLSGMPINQMDQMAFMQAMKECDIDPEDASAS